MTDRIKHNLVDEASSFLQAAGWSFGWYMVEEDGVEFWQADASKGDVSLIARSKVLGLALLQLKNKILGMN